MELFETTPLAGHKRARDEVATNDYHDYAFPAFPSTVGRRAYLQRITNFARRTFGIATSRLALALWGTGDDHHVQVASVGNNKRRIIEASSPSRRLPGSFPSSPSRASARKTPGTVAKMDPYRPQNNFIIDIDDDSDDPPDTITPLLRQALDEIYQRDSEPVQVLLSPGPIVEKSIPEAIDVSITMEDAPPVRPKKTVRWVQTYESVLTGEQVYNMPARKFNNELALQLSPRFSSYRDNDEDQLDNSELMGASPDRHYAAIADRDYSQARLTADKSTSLLDGLRQWLPDVKKVDNGVEVVRNYFERFKIKLLLQEKAEQEEAAKVEREQQIARVQAEKLATEARVQAELDRQRAEEARKKAEKAAANLIADLSAATSKKVDQAMAIRDSETLVTPPPGVRLTRRDMGFILPQKGRDDRADAWLNDEVINLFLTKTCDKAHKDAGYAPNKDNGHQFFAFATQFLPTIAKKGAGAVARWGRRAGIVGDKILTRDLIIIPCNLNGNHWTLLTINPKKRTLTYYDSLGGTGKRETDLVRRFLADQLKDKYDANEWQNIAGETAHQTNGSDCGVFTVFNALAVARGLNPKDVVTAAKMPMARRQMVAVLLAGGFVGDLDW